MSRPDDEWAAELVRNAEPAWDAAKIEERFGSLSRASRRRTVVRAGAGAGALAIAAAVVWWALPRHEVWVASHENSSSRAVVLGDGSTITPIAEATFVVREVSERRVVTVAEAGEVDVEVTPNVEREFVVEAGAVRVVVLGTRFRVQRLDGERTRVSTMRGLVRVEWDGGSSEVGAGEEGVFPPEEHAVADEAPVEAPETPEPEPRRAPHRDWRELAQAGGYEEAYSIIEARGASAVRDEVDDLLLAADAARLSGRGARALPYLERVVRDHATDGRAPMAAFTRGRVLLSLSHPARAGASFEDAMRLGAQGSLYENSLARAVEAYGRAGQNARASELARRYVERYPNGRWRSSVRAYGGIEE
jgi:transmembrane sensor